MMKILAINGSSKGSRSNTWKLTKRFLEGLEEGIRENGQECGAADSGKTGELHIEDQRIADQHREELHREDRHIEDQHIKKQHIKELHREDLHIEKQHIKELQIEELQISSLEIHPCLGCFSCWNRTPGTCCIKNDMEEVIRKLLWADVVIWSFPLYYYTVPGGLKNLIDRQLPMTLPYMTDDAGQTGSGSHPARYDMSGKKTILISTCGFYSAEKNYDGVCSLFDHICGKGKYTAIFCGQGELFRVPELSCRTEEYLGFVREAGKEFVQEGIRPETWENLGQLLYPREVFESMADASWGIDSKTGEREPEAPIDGFLGSILSLAVCAGMPLLFYRNRKTFYDQLSAALVTGFAILSLLGVSGRIVVPLAYLAFGVMWTGSCLCRIPLTACYSMNQYNGEEALRNPLFMRTNRILTLLWGILYLIAPVWTYLIMGTEIGGWVGAVNSVLPALMGVFTVWFQKWYPARIARG